LIHKVVGFGLIALLISYVAWIAIGGSPRSSETVLDDRSGDENSRSSDPQPLEIVTLLGFDAIRSIENPRFVEPTEADETYDSEELVLGVEIAGDARAYSVPLLSRHEIVNDVVGGKPIAITW